MNARKNNTSAETFLQTMILPEAIRDICVLFGTILVADRIVLSACSSFPDLKTGIFRCKSRFFTGFSLDFFQKRSIVLSRNLICVPIMLP